MPSGRYVDDPFVHVTRDGTILGGCCGSYYREETLAAGTSPDPADHFKGMLSGQSRQVRPDIMKSLFSKTVNDLDPATWEGVSRNEPESKAVFASAFKETVQRHLDNRSQSVSHHQSPRTAKLDVLVGARLVPHSCSLGRLEPAWSTLTGPSAEPRVEIKCRDEVPRSFDTLEIHLPFSVTCQALMPNAPGADIDDRHQFGVPATMSYTGKDDWWEQAIVSGSVVLEPSIRHELQSLGEDAIDVANMERARGEIGNNCQKFLERQVLYGTRASTDLQSQRSNHGSITKRSGWRVQLSGHKPAVDFTMEPMAGHSCVVSQLGVDMKVVRAKRDDDV
jgi:hypothetical protein